MLAGTGEQCVPFHEAHCGDGAKAVEAKLMSPRGERLIQNLNPLLQLVLQPRFKWLWRWLSINLVRYQLAYAF